MVHFEVFSVREDDLFLTSLTLLMLAMEIFMLDATSGMAGIGETPSVGNCDVEGRVGVDCKMKNEL